MTKEELAIKLYRLGYDSGANRSQPMTDDELIRYIKLLESKDV